MVSIKLNLRDQLSYLMTGTLPKIFLVIAIGGLSLIYLSFFNTSSGSTSSRLNSGIILLSFSLIGLAISSRKVKKLQNILFNADTATASKGELSPSMINVGYTQVHEVTYQYQVNNSLYQVYLMTLWHNSCKQEEPVLYSKSDHSESILMKTLSDKLVRKIESKRTASKK